MLTWCPFSLSGNAGVGWVPWCTSVGKWQTIITETGWSTSNSWNRFITDYMGNYTLYLSPCVEARWAIKVSIVEKTVQQTVSSWTWSFSNDPLKLKVRTNVFISSFFPLHFPCRSRGSNRPALCTKPTPLTFRPQLPITYRSRRVGTRQDRGLTGANDTQRKQKVSCLTNWALIRFKLSVE